MLRSEMQPFLCSLWASGLGMLRVPGSNRMDSPRHTCTWAHIRSNPALLLNSGLARTQPGNAHQLRTAPASCEPMSPHHNDGTIIFAKMSPVPVKREGMAESHEWSNSKIIMALQTRERKLLKDAPLLSPPWGFCWLPSWSWSLKHQWLQEWF